MKIAKWTASWLLALSALSALETPSKAASAPGWSEGQVTGQHARSGDTLSYRWTCLTQWGEQELGFTMTVSDWASMKREYGRLSHKYTKKWEKRYIFDDPFLGYVRSLASWMQQEAARNGLNVVDVALSFVQSFPNSNWNGQRYAVETLLDQRGDCSDKCMLLAGIFWALGIDYVILELPNHLALGVWSDPRVGFHYLSEGRTYAYCETNAGLRPVGYCPPENQRVGAGIRHPAWP